MPQYDYRKHPNDGNIQYGAWNRLIQNQTAPRIQPPSVVNSPRCYDTIQLENGTDETLDPFGILEVAEATWNSRPDSVFDSEGMRRGVELKGRKVENEWSNISISQKSSPSQSFTPSVVSGPTPVYIFFPDETSLGYPFAVPIPGEIGKLKASPYGLNRILWHEEYPYPIESCVGVTLQGYVNMGEDEQWVWFQLQEDLTCCGSASALLVDECGNQIGECPIIRTVYAPKSFDICQCTDTCDSWKAGEVVPCWWYQYLEKWVTIPNFTAGMMQKSQQVVTEVTLEGAKFQPTTTMIEVVDDVTINPEAVTMTTTEQEVELALNGTLTGTCYASGPVEVSGNANLTGTIPASAFPTSANVTVTGDINTTGTATLSGGTAQTVLTGARFTPATLAHQNVIIPVYDNQATFQGVLNPDGATIDVPVSGLEASLKSGTYTTPKTIPTMEVSNDTNDTQVVADVAFDEGKLSINFNGVSWSFNLSQIATKKTVVTGISLSDDGCTITATTEEISVLNTDSGFVSVTMEGTASITSQGNLPLTPTYTYLKSGSVTVNEPDFSSLAEGISISGSIPIPIECEGTVEYTISSYFTASRITSFSGGSLETDSTSITIPTSASVEISAPATLSGSSDLSFNDIPISVSGSVVSSGSVDVVGTVSIPLDITTTATVEIPNQINIGEGFLTISTVLIPVVEVEVSEATITTNKTTITYLDCKPCEEVE